jgi:hypothetical protein
MIGLPEILVLLFLFGVISAIVIAVMLIRRYIRRKNNKPEQP